MTVKDDLNRLVDQQKLPRKPLGDAAPAPGINASQGFAAPKRKADQNPAGSGSIAAPLTEVNYNDRKWYDDFTVYASDGFFSLTGHRIKQITFQDANGNQVPFDIKDKPAE